MEAVIGPEVVVEIAVGDIDEGNAPLRADGGGDVGLSVRPLAQDGAQGRHEDGAAVELARAADHHVPAAPRGSVEDSREVIGPLIKTATRHEIIGAGAHDEHVGTAHLGQEAVAHATHGRPQPGVRRPLDVAPGPGGDETGDARHQGLVLGGHARAGDERVADGGHSQRRDPMANDSRTDGRHGPIGSHDALAVPGRLRGEVHGAAGYDRLSDGQGTTQPTADAAPGRGEGAHMARVYGRAIVNGLRDRAHRPHPPSSAMNPRAITMSAAHGLRRSATSSV